MPKQNQYPAPKEVSEVVFYLYKRQLISIFKKAQDKWGVRIGGEDPHALMWLVLVHCYEVDVCPDLGRFRQEQAWLLGSRGPHFDAMLYILSKVRGKCNLYKDLNFSKQRAIALEISRFLLPDSDGNGGLIVRDFHSRELAPKLEAMAQQFKAKPATVKAARAEVEKALSHVGKFDLTARFQKLRAEISRVSG